MVPLAIAGTATNGLDYPTHSAAITIPAGSAEGTSVIAPINNPQEEQAETAIFAIKGSLQYQISTNANTCTVQIDDNSPTRYQTFQFKVAAAYQPGVVDSPSAFEVRRYGRSSTAANLAFQVRTNVSGGSQLTSFYVASGNISGNNITFAAYAPNARIGIRPPQNVTAGGGGVDLLIPAVSQELWTTWYQPAYTYVKLEIVNSNVVEGAGAQGRIRLIRPVIGPAVSIDVSVYGNATVGMDHNLSTLISLTIPNNAAASSDLTYSAASDGPVEGWESIAFEPAPLTILAVREFRGPQMAFVRDNITTPELLPEGDFDADLLPDRWEIANNFDPFTAGETHLDPDKDGVTNLEEYKSGTNPNKRDTDGDGELDFVESVRDLSKDDSYVELLLRTGDQGKTADGAGCAVCHTTVLRVGDLSHYSGALGLWEERSIFLKKGTNYPIYLSDLFRDLPPPVPGANPTNSAKYTAEIRTPTNTPQAVVITGAQTNKLGVNKDYLTFFPPNPTLPIGTVTVARIEVLWTNVAGNVALDTNSNGGGGLRVFPDRQHWTDGTARNVVGVRVRTIPPLPAGQQIRLKSFDVDDPMHPSGTLDKILDTNDAGSGAGGDNRGTPLAGQLASTVVTLGSGGDAITTFTVTFQPGDNFRIAAVLETLNAQAHLDNLQVTNANAPFYVAPDSTYPSKFTGGISPMLTVWRKLHLEFDSMLAAPATGPEANGIDANTLVVLPNSPASGRSTIKVKHAIRSGPPDQFQTGKLEVPGINSYAITNSHTAFFPAESSGFITFLEVGGTVPSLPLNTAVRLLDDDDRFLVDDPIYRSKLTLQSPPLPIDHRSGEFVQAMQPRFADAYIQLVDANQHLNWNTARTIPFKRNASPGVQFLDTITSDFDVGNLQLKGRDSAQFWAFSVVFGYEPSAADDGDPDLETPLRGGTPKKTAPYPPHGFSVIYMEAVRDFAFAKRLAQDPDPNEFSLTSRTNFLTDRYLQRLYGVIAHEIGHAPGRQHPNADHAEGEIMQAEGAELNAASFHPRTLLRFRSAVSWTH